VLLILVMNGCLVASFGFMSSVWAIFLVRGLLGFVVAGEMIKQIIMAEITNDESRTQGRSVSSD
jgi:uncharacterized integral membrane protein